MNSALAALSWLGAGPAIADLGVTSFTSSLINQDGTPDTQAGSHPWESTTSFTFATHGSGLPNEDVQTTIVDLPAGLVGNANATDKCTVQQLDQNQCPGSAQVGQLTLSGNSGFGAFSFVAPVYNMVPPGGMPAQFGANVLLVNSFIDVSVVPTGTSADGGYALRTSVNNISAALPLSGVSLTLWGVPADPSHDANRVCAGFTTPCSSSGPMTPLLTMPTSCAGALTAKLTAWSWQSPNSVDTATAQTPGMIGCSRLQFNPSMTAQPTTSVADSPTGVDIDVHVPQAPDSPSGVVTPDLRTAVVTLPTGVGVNTASADGLAACTPAQIGLGNTAQPTCPDGSKIGTVEIDSPIQSDPLTGAIYLAQQGINPFGTPLAIYLAAQSDGVLVKLAGRIDADPGTGQLTTTFANNPQLPFSDLKLNFFSGPRAALVTPESCGTFTTTGSFTPWSGTPAANASDSFQVKSGCVSGFAPSFQSGVSNVQAGSPTTLGITFSRSDSDQELSGLKVALPPGLIAKVAGVPTCPDANAAAGTCPAASRIGTAAVGSGAGSNPFFLPGSVYFTGPYKGAPYGLAVVVPVIAGPFNLGTVVVRQALNIDPHDAHVTVTSDPFPTMLFGIPLRIRRIDVTINRSGFMVNPTSCAPMAIIGTLTSTGGLTFTAPSRFQAGGCASLPFSPKMSAKTNGKRNKARGALLDIRLTQGTGQDHLRSVAVTLPKLFSPRLSTLRSACSGAVFSANPGNCPAGSIVGVATASTPLLSVPMRGNAYLVTHPGSVLPDLDVVLQGGGITFDLVGTVRLAGASIKSTFANIPDVAISSFELKLTQGPHSALADTSKPCATPLYMPTTIIAQDGARIVRLTKVNASGCRRRK